MKKLIFLGLMLLSSTVYAIKQDYPWDPLTPSFTTITLTGGGTIGGMLNVGGTSTFTSSVTVAGNGSNGRLQVIDQINTRTLLASGTVYIGTAGTTAMLGSLEVQSGVNVTGAICAHARSNSATVGKPALLCESETSADMTDGYSTGINFIIKDVSLGENTIAQIAAERAGADNTGNILFKPYTTGSLLNVTTNTATGNWQMPGNVSVAGTLNVGALNFKGQSFEAALLLITPALYDVYWASDTWKLWIATGATPAGFKCSAAFGATP